MKTCCCPHCAVLGLSAFLRTPQWGLLERAGIPVFAGFWRAALGEMCSDCHAEHAPPAHAAAGPGCCFPQICNYSSLLFNTDDGKLSFEEFKNYFSDGILSSEELWELFSSIDRRHSE